MQLLEEGGFSTAQVKGLRIRALPYLAGTAPETILERMDGLDLEIYQRNAVLNGLFCLADDPEKARDLIAGLPTQDERNAAVRILDQQTAPEVEGKVNTAENFFAKLAPDEADNSMYF